MLFASRVTKFLIAGILGLLVLAGALYCNFPVGADGPDPPFDPIKHATAGAAHTVTEADTAAFAIPANVRSIIWVSLADGEVPTVTSAGRTWTLVGTATSGTRRLSAHTSLSTSATDESINIEASTSTDITWTAVTSALTTIAQYKVDAVLQSEGLVYQGDITFDDTGTGRVVAGFVSNRGGRPFSAGSGFALLGPNACDVGAYSVICSQLELRASFQETASMTWVTAGHWIGVSVELE